MALYDITPDKYLDMSDPDLITLIREKKKEHGKRLTILGHNYQRLAVYKLADHQGDSYGLSKIAAENEDAEFIVFCGVRFMASTARILAKPEQKVIHPTALAGCPMADMADLQQVEKAWQELGTVTDTGKLIPVTYMNADADLKAFCGEHGGIVCTSSNAFGTYKWSFERGEKILFFPDAHLGRNTANAYGIPKDEQIEWDWRKPLGGNDKAAIAKAKVLLWKGFCHVHQWFTTDHIEEIRAEYPEVKVIVHPECMEEVVAAADESGSTNFIEKYIEKAAPGSVTAIGTEIQMISRLAITYPEKTVLPLSRSLCPNMYKTNLANLAYSLDRLGEVNLVELPAPIIEKAGVALRRMLEVQN